MITSLNYKLFYKKLGNLFFAIAAADNRVSRKEKQALEEIIQYQWKHLNDTTDRFGTDAAYLILFQFETLNDAIVHAENAYLSFEHFFREHQDEIDFRLRQKIFQSAVHVAEGVRGINHEELEYLVRLKALMEL